MLDLSRTPLALAQTYEARVRASERRLAWMRALVWIIAALWILALAVILAVPVALMMLELSADRGLEILGRAR